MIVKNDMKQEVKESLDFKAYKKQSTMLSDYINFSDNRSKSTFLTFILKRFNELIDVTLHGSLFHQVQERRKNVFSH